jgi:hypothetical protein
MKRDLLKAKRDPGKVKRDPMKVKKGLFMGHAPCLNRNCDQWLPG